VVGEDPATWRCRRSQGASDGPALPHGRRDPAHIQDDRIVTAWARAGVGRIATAGQQARRAKHDEVQRASFAGLSTQPVSTSAAADASGVRAALQVDFAQQPVDVGQQTALDVPQLGVGPGVHEHQLGEDVAVGPRDLERDLQGHRLPRRAGHVGGDEVTEGRDAAAQLDQQPPERDQDFGFGMSPFLDALGEVGQVPADPTDLDRRVLQGP